MTCGCSLCHCLHRVHQLVAQGSPLHGFVEYAGIRLRIVEAELRDELARLGWREGSVSAPNVEQAPARDQGTATPDVGATGQAGQEKAGEPAEATAKASQAAAESVVKEEPATPTALGEGQASTSQSAPKAPASRTAEEVGLEIYPKSCPRAPNSPIQRIPAIAEEAEGLDPTRGEAAAEEGEESEPAEVAEKKKKKKSRSRKRRRSEAASEAKSARGAARGSKDSKRRRSRSRRSRSRRRREPSEAPREERGREKKTRSERPPEPLGLPPVRRERRSPRQPGHPPPGRWQRGQVEQGPGWIGPVPYSSHPRWDSGKSKGVARRAKQERYNQRRRGEHGR